MNKHRVILAAIGTSDYEKVNYQFTDGDVIPAKYFLVGLVNRLKPNTVVALLTEEAKTLQWTYKDGSGVGDRLQQLGVNVVAVDIPKGANEDEAWQIFEKIAEHVPDDSEVILDITHGLRSIPVLMLLATFYLQRVRNIAISDIYYGALEAVDRAKNPKPAYSLGHFLTLLDWAGGVELFRQTGDAKRLAELLEARQTTVRKTQDASIDGELPRHLKSVSATLLNLSQSLGVIRPKEIMENAAKLQGQLESAIAESRKWAKPFALVLDQIRAAFVPFALTDPLSKHQQFITAQMELIEWYIRHRQFDAAVLLLRELIVTWYLLSKGKTDIDNVESREWAEKNLRGLFEHDKKDPLGGLWMDVCDIRNDIAHTGMRKDPKPAKRLSELIGNAFDNFKKLYAQGLDERAPSIQVE